MANGANFTMLGRSVMYALGASGKVGMECVIESIEKERYYNSNMFLKGIIYDSHKNIYNEKDIFCKTISILDPNQSVIDNYNLRSKRPSHLPSNYNYNSFHKINDIDNTQNIFNHRSKMNGLSTSAIWNMDLEIQLNF